MKQLASFAVLLGLVISWHLAGPVRAQVGKSLGVVDANIASEMDLLALPHMTSAIVKGLVEKRPFASIVDLNAFLVSQSLSTIMFEVEPRDPIVFGGVVGVLVTAGLLACYRPVRRASRVDPLVALRSD